MGTLSEGENTVNQVKILLSTYDKPKIFIDGFVNKKCRNRDNLFYWVCKRSGKNENICECKAIVNAVFVNGEYIIRSHNPMSHNRAPEAKRSQITTIRNIMKELAVVTDERLCKIVRNMALEVDKLIPPQLPSNSALKQLLLCKQRKNKEPRNIDEFNLSDNVLNTLNENPFVKIYKRRI